MGIMRLLIGVFFLLTVCAKLSAAETNRSVLAVRLKDVLSGDFKRVFTADINDYDDLGKLKAAFKVLQWRFDPQYVQENFAYEWEEFKPAFYLFQEIHHCSSFEAIPKKIITRLYRNHAELVKAKSLTKHFNPGIKVTLVFTSYPYNLEVAKHEKKLVEFSFLNGKAKTTRVGFPKPNIEVAAHASGILTIDDLVETLEAGLLYQFTLNEKNSIVQFGDQATSDSLRLIKTSSKLPSNLLIKISNTAVELNAF